MNQIMRKLKLPHIYLKICYLELPNSQTLWAYAFIHLIDGIMIIPITGMRRNPTPMFINVGIDLNL